ncbi:hypothetical protein EJ573_01440 [Paenibacillus polymyxa]|uniref:hypothetical protein n=1 Tax=Paenibacillus polymyxa TaxID=1406 RepID=UPI000F876726|nr:hypothetical protein [Paenibacillus polymyxa]RTZ37899.1 hypothetical protein EJ573_01440 [Paenibacillus polymyxa]
MFTIFELSNEENRLVQEAKNNFGQYFTFSKDMVDYFWTFVNQIDAPAYVFNAFLTQAGKSLSLSLLSIVRHHVAQSYLVLRSAIESVTLACYALYKPDENNFVRRDENNPQFLHEKSKVKNKAYEWLGQKYPIHSDRLKFAKSDFINKYFAHSNLIDAITNVIHGQSKFFNSVFDDSSPLTIKIRLVSFSNLIIVMADLIGLVLKDYPLAKVKFDHEEQIKRFYAISKSLHQRITNETKI